VVLARALARWRGTAAVLPALALGAAPDATRLGKLLGAAAAELASAGVTPATRGRHRAARIDADDDTARVTPRGRV
jgi:hypothetical protein